MKKLLLSALGLIACSIASFGQTLTTVDLSLINTTSGTSVAVGEAGGTVTFNIEITGPASTPALDSFDLQLSGSGTSVTALPTGITLTGYSNLVTNFGGNQNLSKNSYSANANSTANDISFSSTPVTLVTVTFSLSSTLAPGTYSIDFAPGPGNSAANVSNGLEGLYTASKPASTIAYTPVDATIVVAAVPEPSVMALFLAGGLGMLAFGWVRRTA